MTTDLGPLLAAVTDEWERGKTIAERAGFDPRTGGQRLARLVREGLIESMRKPAPKNIGDQVLVYRRTAAAPPAPPSSVDLVTQERDALLAAIDAHRDALDRRALGAPAAEIRDRDDVDNDLYNVAHRMRRTEATG